MSTPPPDPQQVRWRLMAWIAIAAIAGFLAFEEVITGAEFVQSVTVSAPH